MTLVCHTVGDLLQALRNVDPARKLRTEAALPESWKPPGVRCIAGDAQELRIFPTCVILTGRDPDSPAPPVSPPPYVPTKQPYRRRRA